jgi:hypothetical protein
VPRAIGVRNRTMGRRMGGHAPEPDDHEPEDPAERSDASCTVIIWTPGRGDGALASAHFPSWRRWDWHETEESGVLELAPEAAARARRCHRTSTDVTYNLRLYSDYDARG